jgi:predicted O-linked N-acetylglucosamine transferase (SPINDLY family)
MLPSYANAGPLNVAQAYDRALTLHKQGRFNEAEQLYAQVLAARPDHVDALHMMGVVKHAKGQLPEALRFIAAAMGMRKPTPVMFYNQGLVQNAMARPEEALASFEQAIKLKSKFADAHKDRGVVLVGLGRHEEALAAFNKAIAIRPDYAEAYFNRALSLQALGRHDESLKSLDRAIALNPNYVKAHNNRGYQLLLLGRHEEALASYDRAVALDPDFVIAVKNRSHTLHQLNRFEESLRHLDAALARRPGAAELHASRIMALYMLGRFEEALAAVERTLELDPNAVKAHSDRGVLLVTLNRYPAALASFDHALALNPDFAEARHGRGRVLFLMNRFDEALAYCSAAVAQQPDDAESYYIRGRVLLELNRNDEALADFGRTLALKPNHADARFGDCFAELPIVYRDADEVDVRRIAYERKLRVLRADVEAGTLAAVDKAVSTRQPFYLAYQGRNDRDLQAVYGGMISGVVEPQFPAAPMPPPPAPGEPIRVGFVSGFFINHSNWKMPIKGWLSQLDRSRFKLFGYHLALEHDAETAAAAAMCDRFVQLPLNVAGWRREILADAPHVLIYPGILMDTISTQLAALRLAPVQCNSWGHPETSGLPTLDYYLSSDLMEPPQAAESYTERLVRLPNLSVYYEPVATVPVALSRKEIGVRDDAVAFWSGQSLFKYLPEYDDVFPRIAKQAPQSQFVFIRHRASANVTEVFQARLDRAFAAHGLSWRDYCVFVDRLNQSEFVAAQGLCDVFLDSAGWSGCNSTLESLAHDLPIVTLPGAFMRGRHSAAILEMMGVTETIAATLDDYVALAARLANSPEERQAASRRIAGNKARVYRDRACVTGLEDFLERAVRQPAN